jgi:hypothetical protein
MGFVEVRKPELQPDHAQAATRAALEVAAFDGAWAAGRALAFEQSIAKALAVADGARNRSLGAPAHTTVA